MQFADGSMSGVEHYVDGKKSGRFEYWYRNGQRKTIGEFTEGEFGSVRKTQKHPDRS